MKKLLIFTLLISALAAQSQTKIISDWHLNTVERNGVTTTPVRSLLVFYTVDGTNCLLISNRSDMKDQIWGVVTNFKTERYTDPDSGEVLMQWDFDWTAEHDKVSGSVEYTCVMVISLDNPKKTFGLVLAIPGNSEMIVYSGVIQK